MQKRKEMKVVELEAEKLDKIADSILASIRKRTDLDLFTVCAALHVIIKRFADNGIAIELVDDTDVNQQAHLN